jgi:GAF domain-containing protein
VLLARRPVSARLQATDTATSQAVAWGINLMQADGKARRQLFDEFIKLRQRVTELEAIEAECKLELVTLQQSNVCLQVLYDIARAGLEEQSAETVTPLAVDCIGRLAPCQRVRIALFDFQARRTSVWTRDAEGKPWAGAGTRCDLQVLSGDSLRTFGLNEGLLSGECASRGLGTKILQTLQAEGICLCLSVLLAAHGIPIGMLNAWASSSNGFTAEQIENIHQVASVLATVLYKAH